MLINLCITYKCYGVTSMCKNMSHVYTSVYKRKGIIYISDINYDAKV